LTLSNHLDEDEIGTMNPNVRSIIAYTADSKVIETVRPNGILMAQITPRGGIISVRPQLFSWTHGTGKMRRLKKMMECT
jgi:hypothetical protein